MVETKNAVITHVSMSSADHGCLSSFLTLDYGGSSQGFGGFALYQPKPDPKYAEHYKGDRGLKQRNFAGHFIWRCMEIGGVDEWSKLVGRTIRVRCEHSRVHSIGHIVKDDWFNPTEEFAAACAETGKEGE